MDVRASIKEDVAAMIWARRLHTELQGLVSRTVPTVDDLLKESQSLVEVLCYDRTEEEIFSDAMQSSKIWIAETIAHDTFDVLSRELLASGPLKLLITRLVKGATLDRIA